MKKLFTILILVLMANVTLVWGQTTAVLGGLVTCPVPQAIPIAVLPNDALHPVPGTSYTYSVSVPAPVGGTKSYKWIVTQQQTFLTTGVLNITGAEAVGGLHIAAAGAAELNNTITEPTASGEDIDITWKSFIHDAAQPVFVVIYVENNDGTCTTQNMKVYQIEPVNAFTLDIANVEQTGTVEAYGATYSTCVSNIASAIYDGTVGALGVIYDFGTDYLFFTVTAANFTTSWDMSLTVTGITGTQAITNVDWAYNNAPTTWAAFTLGTPSTVNVQTGSTVGIAGECILIRVTIAHNKEEVLLPQTITVAVDGVTNVTLPDLHHVDGVADGFTNDLALHIMKPRPTINSTTPTFPGVDFLPKK